MSSTAPQPSLLFSFNGSNVETITGLTPTLSLSTSYTTGKYGQAIYFNGTAGALPATSNIVYSVPSFTVSSFTVSLWVNATSLASGGNNIILAWKGYNAEGDLRIAFNGGTTSTSIYVVYPFVTGSFIGATSPTSFPIGQWVHVASTITVSPTSNVITNYYNGISAGSVTSATRNNSSPLTTLALGSFANGLYNSQFNGLVQDLRFYNTALSAPQILGIYQSQGIPPRLTATSNVVQPSLLFSFNGSNVDSVTNLSPSSTTGTPSYTTGKYGQGIFFPFYNTGSQSITYTIPAIVCNGITICMWVYFNDISMFRLDAITQTIVSATVPYTGFPNQQLAINSRTAGGTQNMLFQGVNGASGFFSYTATVAKQWYHLTLVSSGSGSPSSYVNGVSYATTGSTLTPFSLNSLTLTGHNCVYNDLRIYNTALSTPQILGIYQSQGIPPNMALTQTSRSGTSTTMNSG